MIVLFVHGMGRTSLSGWRLVRRLRCAGLKTLEVEFVAAGAPEMIRLQMKGYRY